MILSAAQIAQLAAAAGWSGNDLITAVAIALAESSGNTAAYNPETQAGAPQGQGSIGLWQIFLAAHPEFAGEDLTDPQTNANAAYSIYAIAGGFAPWSTYTSGAFQKYLPTVMAAVSAPLTLDAATGKPIADSTPTPAGNVVSSAPASPPNVFNAGFVSTSPALPAAAVMAPGPSFGQALLWSIIGVATLWLFSEIAP